MVTKTKAPAAPAAPRRARTQRASAPPAAAPAAAPAPADKPNLIRAGLQALDKARQDVAAHQSRVFEAILGFEPVQSLSGLVRPDSTATKVAAEALGLRKFEAVFDQRVAHALERMGLPSAEALNALIGELAAQRAEIAALRDELHGERRAPKAPPRRR
jgi:hypothetical protein